MDAIFEYAGYLRDVMLLNISFFAAVFGRKEKTRDSWIRIKLLQFFESGKINKWIEDYLFPNGIKQTKIPYWVFFLNLLYTIFYFSLSEYPPSYQTVFVLFSSVTLVFMFLVRFIAIGRDAERFTEKIVEEKYIKFSEDIDNEDELLIIAGNLSFFGKVPKISGHDEDHRTHCRQSFNSNACIEGARGKCLINKKNCVFKHPQFRQLVALRKNNKSFTLKLLVRRPTNNEEKQQDEHEHGAVLGKLLDFFGEKIDVRFYKSKEMSDSIKLLARIKTSAGKNIMFWNWKNLDKTYSTPEELREESPMGSTFIYLFNSLLWETADEISPNERSLYISTYKYAIK